VVGVGRGALIGQARAGRARAGRARDGLARHWGFGALLVLAAGLRAVVSAAYQPALIFPDSVRYLQYAQHFADGRWTVDGLRQSGYSVLLVPVMLLHDLWLIPLVQHLIGLATGVLVYAVLVRFGVRAPIAALAAIPVLFDPLELVLEQYVLSDTWTVFLLVAALVVLAWPRAGGGWRTAAAGGLLLGVAVTFRDQELIMIVPAAVYVVVTARPWRRLAALAGCFLIPVGAYLGWSWASHGEPGFTTFSGAFLYGRVADFASCQGLNLPGYERPLCPAQPPAQRNADFYTWDPRSPQWTFRPPAGMSRDAVVQDFSLRILRHQPLAYAEAAGRDYLYGFAPVRGAGPERYSPAYLQFHRYIQPDRQADASIGALGYQPPSVRQNLASFLTGYGRWFYVPGPVFAGGLALALAGLTAGARRRDKRVNAGLLFTASAVLVLVPPALFATFDWRYQLPQLTLIPVAAVIGGGLLTRRRRALGSSVGAPAVGTSRRGPLQPPHGPDQLCGGHGQHVVRDEDVAPDQAAVEVDDEPAPGRLPGAEGRRVGERDRYEDPVHERAFVDPGHVRPRHRARGDQRGAVGEAVGVQDQHRVVPQRPDQQREGDRAEEDQAQQARGQTGGAVGPDRDQER
jgi:4-amino-4-deoxy-L-arabinose transferase-like glycosyltransferase